MKNTKLQNILKSEYGDREVVATTPHGSYTFDITGWAIYNGRLVLRLVEIERKEKVNE